MFKDPMPGKAGVGGSFWAGVRRLPLYSSLITMFNTIREAEKVAVFKVGQSKVKTLQI